MGALVAELAAARIGDTFNQYGCSRLRQERLAAQGVARGRRLVAVGRLAQRATGAPYVRHPARGGAEAFRSGLAGLLS